MTVNVKFKRLSAGAKMPKYGTIGAAGADVCACLSDQVILAPGQRTIVPLGFAIEIQRGFEVQVRPRSGIAINKGITVLNAPGTIDSDYRGECGVILINHGDADFVISHGDRIAQIVLAPFLKANFIEVDDLDDTDRGAGGYGSTGVTGV